MEAFDPNAAPAESSVVTAGEGSLVGGLPVPALAAIVLVVGALIAALVFGG
jgi:hypothetical protein